MIIWTRRSEQWLSDADYFSETAQVVSWPLTAPVPLRPDLPRVIEYDIAIYDGQTAHAATQDESLLTYMRSAVHVYCQDDWIKAHLSKFGVDAHIIASSEGPAEFAAKLVRNKPVGSKIIVFGPKDPVYPFSSHLNLQGLASTHLSIYEEVPSNTPIPDELKNEEIKRMVVCLTSVAAVRSFKKKFKGISTKTQWIPITIGENTRISAQRLLGKCLPINGYNLSAISNAANGIDKLLRASVDTIVYFDGNCPICSDEVIRYINSGVRDNIRFSSTQGSSAKIFLPKEVHDQAREFFAIDLDRGKFLEKGPVFALIQSNLTSKLNRLIAALMKLFPFFAKAAYFSLKYVKHSRRRMGAIRDTAKAADRSFYVG